MHPCNQYGWECCGVVAIREVEKMGSWDKAVGSAAFFCWSISLLDYFVFYCLLCVTIVQGGCTMGTTTLTIRIDEKTKNRLEKLAQATDRTMSYLVSSTIERILDEEEWQIGEIRKRVRIANGPDAAFIDHEEIEAWLKSWGTKEETEPPQCK